jgi:hypothetical protein
MGQDIIVNQKRGAASLTQNIPIRKVNMSVTVATDMGGAAPYDSFWFYTEQGVGSLDIARKDLLIDTVTNEHYRVFGRPQVYDQSMIKMAVEQVVGS